MEAAAVSASAAAAAAKDAALAASVAAVAAAKDAAAAVATANEASAAAKEAALAASAAASNAKEAAATASAAALNAKEAAVTASAAALEAKEAAAVAASAGEVAVAAAAAMQASKKRKFHLVDHDQDPPGTVDVSDGGSGCASAGEVAVAAADAMQACKNRKFHLVGDDQEPRGSVDVGDGGSADFISHLPDAVLGSVDFISRLPDTVLGSIVSLLPTKEGARTQAISRRWRPLWRSAPLNLVAGYEYMNKGTKIVDLIPKIISEHPGPGRCFSLSIYVQDFMDYYDKIEGWLRSHALDNLQELELTYLSCSSSVKGKQLCPLPSSTYRSAPTLRVAKFSGCHFPNLIVQLSLKFPCLKQLTLESVNISQDAIQSMLSGCSALESLELKNKLGFDRLCISSQTLKSIGFCSDCTTKSGVLLDELVIESAPCLERLLPLAPKYGPATIRISSAPKLKILGMVSEDIAELQFGTTVFQKMIVVGLAPKMHTVRVLFLGSTGPNRDTVFNFLKCFPCLERLYVIFQSGMGMENVQKYDLLDPIECVELHLKEVVIKNYNGLSSKSINFTRFFVLHAKVLKEMKITTTFHRQREWFARQYWLLLVESRASRDARIELTCGTSSKFGFPRNSHIHDFSMDDPFDVPSRRCFKCSQ